MNNYMRLICGNLDSLLSMYYRSCSGTT